MLGSETGRIKFFYLHKAFYFPSRKGLKAFLLKLFDSEGFKVEAVNYIFCSDEYLLSLNQAHLKHETLTDIITFQYSENKEPVLSDIYISIDRVRENAQIYKTTFRNELYRVILHGALHLCGYKDKSKLDVARMRDAENKYLAQYRPSST